MVLLVRYCISCHLVSRTGAVSEVVLIDGTRLLDMPFSRICVVYNIASAVYVLLAIGSCECLYTTKLMQKCDITGRI